MALQRASERDRVPVAHYEAKSKNISIGLSLVFGGLGAHKFYLDKPGKGFLYLLFCWTGIPSIIGIIDAVRYISMDEEEFQQRYTIGTL